MARGWRWPAVGVGVVVAGYVALRVWAASADPPAGVGDGSLGPCPDSPKCVSSLATDPEHAVDPLWCPEGGIDAVRAAVEQLPGATVRHVEPGYLWAVVTTRWIGFRDDLELRLDGDRVDVRSASRLGYSDLGANRDRVRRLRDLVAEACGG